MNEKEIAEVVRLLKEGKRYAEIAKMLNMSVDAVKRRYYASKKQNEESVSSYKLGGDAKDRKILMQADEITRLKKEIKNQHRENIEAEYINEVLGTIANTKIEPPNWLLNTKDNKKEKEVLMTSWADWHAGEVVYKSELNGINEYNMKIFERRVKRLVENTIKLSKNHGPGNYPGAVVNLLGDMVSGGLHEEHRKTDEMPPHDCVLRVVELLSWGLTQMADAFGKVYVPCVCGNHGRTTIRPEYKQYVHKNYDYLIYKILEREMKKANENRIVIDVRESNEVLYKVYGTSYLAVHGDMISKGGGDGIIGSLGPIARGEIKTRGRASSSGMEYDILLMGHYHQSFWLPRVICANSLKGYCEYSKNALNAPPAPPTQPMWFHHPRYGITSRWEIMVEEPVSSSTTTTWASVFDPTK